MRFYRNDCANGITPGVSGVTPTTVKRNRSGQASVYRSKGIVKKRNGKVYSCPRWIARCPNANSRVDSVGPFSSLMKTVPSRLAVIGLRMKSVDRDEVLAHL